MRAPSMSRDEEPVAADLDLPHPRSIRTTDPFEARIRTQEFLGCSHRMTVLERDVPFQAGVQYRSSHGLGLLTSSYGPAVEIGCSPPIELVTVNFLVGGEMLIEDETGTSMVADGAHAAAFCFHEDVRMRWSPGLRQVMLTIDKPLVQRYLRNLLHEPIRRPLRFDTSIDLAGSGQALVAAVRMFRRALEHGGPGGPPPVLAAELEHSVLTALLLGQSHNYTEAIFSATALPSPRVVRRVQEFVDSAPETPLTVADLASLAGVSARSLQAAFRKHVGTSPMCYVRRRRLERARDELLGLDPSAGVTVTDVALRHGFGHTGRFAAAYRAAFGESPSVTLRR